MRDALVETLRNVRWNFEALPDAVKRAKPYNKEARLAPHTDSFRTFAICHIHTAPKFCQHLPILPYRTLESHVNLVRVLLGEYIIFADNTFLLLVSSYS